MKDQTRTRVSASAFPRLAQCPASLGRAAEVAAFLSENALEYPTIDNYAAKGDAVHALVASIEVRHPVLTGSSMPPLFKTVARQCESFGIEPRSQEFWFAFNALKARDALIGYMVNVAGGAGMIERFDMRLDSERLFEDLDIDENRTERISGIADFRLALHKRDGTCQQLIVDWKSGWGAVQDSESDRQLHALAVLAAGDAPNTTAVYAAKLVASEQWSRPRLVRFDRATLRAARSKIRSITRDAVDALEIVEQAQGKPSPKDSARLDQQAQTGNHCMYCAGKMACRKIQQTMEREHSQRVAPQIPVVRAAGAAIKAQRKEGKDMDIEHLKAVTYTAQALVKDTGVVDRFRKEAEAVLRQLAQKEQIDGVNVKQGVLYPALAKDADGNSPSVDAVIDAVAQGVRKLNPAVDADYLKQTLFERSAGLSASSLRDVVAEVLEMKKPEALAALMDAMGEDCPLTLEERAGPVIIEQVQSIGMAAAI